MRIIIGYLVLYAIITLGSIFISSLLNKKIEKTISINICFTILILYLFGIFNCLKLGVYVIAILNIILGIIAIIKEKKNILKIFLTPGFAFFSIMYFILMITTLNKQLIEWDQFTYRSLNVKIMYNTDTMTSGYGVLYPPASTLLEYFFMKIIGIYRQGIEAFAMQIFGFSLILPIYDNIKNHKIPKIVAGIIILCIPAVFWGLAFYQTSYPDATLGLILGFILYTYFTENSYKYKIFAIGTAIATLVLLKPFGIAISMILICILTIYEFLKNKYILKNKFKSLLKSKEIKFIITILLVALMIFASWEIVQKLSAGKTKFEINSNRVEDHPIEYVLKSINTTVFGVYEEDNDGADSNGTLIPKLYSVIGFIVPIKIALLPATIIIMATYMLYYYKIKDAKFKFLSIAISIGVLLYIIFLQFAYLIKFSTYEMLGHNGIDRYYSTFLLAILYFIVLIVMYNLNNKEYNSKKYMLLLVIILMITPIQSIFDATITSGIYNINSIEYINNSKNIADKIDEYIEDGSKIITISQIDDTRLYNIMLKYYLYPNHDAQILENMTQESIEDIIEILKSKEYQYIYIFSTDTELTNILKIICNNLDDIKEKTLYKIEYENENNIQLIEQVYIDEKI